MMISQKGRKLNCEGCLNAADMVGTLIEGILEYGIYALVSAFSRSKPSHLTRGPLFETFGDSILDCRVIQPIYPSMNPVSRHKE